MHPSSAAGCWRWPLTGGGLDGGSAAPVMVASCSAMLAGVEEKYHFPCVSPSLYGRPQE